MPTVSVIMPVFYNELSLQLLFRELVKVEESLRGRGLELELIFVDDGSGDDSLGELLKIKQERQATRIIKHTRNFGSIHACKTGLSFATGDCFMFLAADLQDPPELIPKMVEVWQRGAKYVIAARTDRDDPLPSKFFASIYYKLLRLMVVRDYPHDGFDVALMDRVLLPYLQQSGKNINLSLFTYWLGFNPEIVAYKRRARLHGKSRWTFRKRVKLLLDSLLGFSIVPIRLISLIGIAVSLISSGYGVLVIANAILGNPDVTGVRGFATLVALVTFLLGLIIVMLGVIGEYIWRIFDETNQRPEAVIDEIY